jgi:hypothetical protein
MKFTINNKTSYNFNTGYDNKTTEEVLTTKFLALETDDNLNWIKHIEYIIPKLNSACFIMRTVIPLLTVDTFKISLLCLFSFGHVMIIYHPKENHLNNDRCKKKSILQKTVYKV